MSKTQQPAEPQTPQPASITLRGGVPSAPTADGYVAGRNSDLVVAVGDQEVGRFEFSARGDRFEIDDMAAFEAYAEDQGALVIQLAPDPAWTQSILKYAAMDSTTGHVFDTRSEERIPGLKFVSGGVPASAVTWTWRSQKALLDAYYRGDLDVVLQPDPAAGPQPAAEDA